MVDELITILDQADLDDSIKAIIVTGNGRAFCAGADLGKGTDTFASQENSEEEFRDWGGRLSLRIFEMNKPMIAAINGAAVGVGATMTLPMDICIATSTSKFGFVFTRRGIAPELAVVDFYRKSSKSAKHWNGQCQGKSLRLMKL